MVFKIPKTIAQHPAMEEALDGPSQGSDYKYDVWLKEGWVFENGRMAGCRGARFNNVADFLSANPIRKDK
jgi:hypothetical protein